MSVLDNLLSSNANRLETRNENNGAVAAMIGTVESDSSGGVVNVTLPGAVVNADTITGSGGSSVPLPCIESCSEGDSVYVLLVGSDNVKTPIVLGAAGGGDSLEARVAALEQGGPDFKIIGSNDSEPIADEAYMGRNDIVGASFTNCTQIGARAFANCRNLEFVNFLGMGFVKTRAFYWCVSLKSFSSITDVVGKEAFSNCLTLESVSLPYAHWIEQKAFENCYSLANFSAPMAQIIEDSAFYDCRSIRRLSFPNATSIGEQPFEKMLELERLDVGSASICPDIHSDNPLQVLNFCQEGRVSIPDYSDPQRGAHDPLVNSTIARGSGYIYINDNLVSTMSVANGWSTYASQIRPWSELRC